MTLRLFLIRHAKSDWDDPSLPDDQRTLNERGRRSAPLIGKWMAAQGYLPQQVLCSSAVRTRETHDLLQAEWGSGPKVTYLPDLYLAPARTMLDCLRKATAPQVAMIGHNPGIGSFACGLVHERPTHPKYATYPTCATAVIDFDCDTWADVDAAKGQIVAFITPRELENE